ncbi:radical SAM protein [bacterium]|nr:radical SAM protein [bacterium]
MLKVNEIFKSIQGEGSFAGRLCSFIRLTGCNLRCGYCDTKYAYKDGDDLSIEEIIQRVKMLGQDLVEITGGEPLLQKETTKLIDTLIKQKYIVLIETNGTISIKNINQHAIIILDLKCPGSKMSAKTLWKNIEYLRKKDEVKFVIGDRKDYDWAKDIAAKYNLTQRVNYVHFSPVYGKLVPKELAEWICCDNLDVRMQIQIHKYIWGSDARGV